MHLEHDIPSALKKKLDYECLSLKTDQAMGPNGCLPGKKNILV